MCRGRKICQDSLIDSRYNMKKPMLDSYNMNHIGLGCPLLGRSRLTTEMRTETQDPNNKNPILPSNSVVSNFLESLGLPTVFLPYSTSDWLSKSSDDINQLKNGTKLDLRATFDFG